MLMEPTVAGEPLRLFVAPADARNLTDAIRRVAGWDAIENVDSTDTAACFLRSGAVIAVVDARDDAIDGLALTASLDIVVKAAAAALLVILDADSAPRLAAYHAAGATHFVIAPSTDEEIVQSIRFALRHVSRVRGERGERRALPPSWLTGGNGARVAAWIDERIAQGMPLTVALVALSRLDIANAAHGRPGGDTLIKAMGGQISDIAEAVFGSDAAVARVGGSEFVLAMAGDHGRAETAIARLGEALARPVAIDDTRAVFGSRLGIARRQPGDNAAILLRRTADALASAQGSDGSTIRVAGPDNGVPLGALAIDIHHAIGRDEIDIVFQPQVEIASGRITGVEALARWEHPTLGPLGADALFAAANRADLGVALSDHIQRLVLSRAAHWPRELAGLRLALNLTAVDVARPGFAELFLSRVDASGFPRGRLTIEITETGMMRDLGVVATLLTELRGAGCRVAIDDFGTGYSSLAYLKALPLDYLKIDKALTTDIAGSARDRVVVRGVIEMARALGVATIAEGVENEVQLNLLAADGCSYFQGFLMAPPLTETRLLGLMESRQ